MLLEGHDDLEKIAAFLEEIAPDRICLSIPTRPPGGRERVRPAGGVELARALERLPRAPRAELMTHEPGTASVATVEELLAVLAVHPLRASHVAPALARDPRVRRVAHGGTTFLALRQPGAEG
jgi:wyosine [tRNA(Phe)-imidazoG37] synthetase (radical SAM superfamily)